MNKKLIAKTLLTALSKYEQFLAAIDKSILDKAQYSYIRYTNTMQTIDSIIDSMQKKTVLHNLRVKTEHLLDLTPHKFRRTLILAYIHQMTAKQISKLIRKTERTVFRYLQKGLEWFSTNIEYITDNYGFMQVLDEEMWIRNIYNRLQDS
jgi:DNA-directed RNA polymerase specialized sigma24 family protein